MTSVARYHTDGTFDYSQVHQFRRQQAHDALRFDRSQDDGHQVVDCGDRHGQISTARASCCRRSSRTANPLRDDDQLQRTLAGVRLYPQCRRLERDQALRLGRFACQRHAHQHQRLFVEHRLHVRRKVQIVRQQCRRFATTPPPTTSRAQTYVTETQHSTAAGAVTLAHAISIPTERCDYFRQVINSDGSKLTSFYDATGHKTTTVKWLDHRHRH